MGFLSLLGYIGKTFLLSLFNGVRGREAALNKLREQWNFIPKGTPIVFDQYIALHQILAGGTSPSWSKKPPPYYLIKPGQGAMLMQIYWPVVREDKELESPVRFVLWCNQGHYEYIFLLSEYNGTLPFHMLA
jgi:hypothetical protein